MGVRTSIHAKLIGFAAVLIATIVGFLSWYFSARHIDALSAEQHARVETYGVLFANELKSAIAFDDRATAKEVLGSLAGDPDVASITLFDQAGDALFQSGTPGTWIDRARHGVMSRKVFDERGRVAVVAPVVSLEGPRGTLVVELATARLHAEETAILITAVVVGIAALGFGVLAAWLIARSLVRRLRAINVVATAVAKGDRADTRVVVDSQDEIGVLAVAFNQMLGELRDTQLGLEARVADRTAELRASNAQLASEMQRRGAVELELRQAQKLEAVGRLAAGVAHEINTPIQFASDSCTFLSEAAADLLAALADNEAACATFDAGAIDAAELRDRLARSARDHDTAYLVATVPEAVGHARAGLDRVAGIVRAMKEFAYSDVRERSSVDLNRAIQSTLVVASNEYKYVAEVRTELGELPPVVCNGGELNQVFLNIVVNAAHAIAAAKRGTRGTIAIRSARDGDCVVIAISDDGCGIPAAVIDNIFDPFFTTKEIGKGTGQGLAIARSVIVDKHGGRLDVASQVGVGTTFTIRIPIDGASSAAALAA
jgi:signal transduction histidine kinase